MDWQPGPDDGTGDGPDRGPGGAPARDPRLAQFAGDALSGRLAPSGRLALLAHELSGPERRCPGATDDELLGLLQAWAVIESWAAGAKSGVIREMIRRGGIPSLGSDHGDLPETWSQSLRYDLAAALACSTQSAEKAVWLAWEQQARLPGIGALLNNGTLTAPKARAVTETFEWLMDADAADAEALILDQLAGKTYTQVLRLAEQAALTVDPGFAERRRQQTRKRDARVSFFREQAGTAALSGRDLPPDEALAAMAAVNARADDYKQSQAFGDAQMDALRAQAYLDLINGISADARIAIAEPQDDAADNAESMAWAQARAAARAAAKARPGADPRTQAHAGEATPPTPDADESGADCPCTECDGSCRADDHDTDPDPDEPDDDSGHDEDDDDGPDDGGPDDDGGGHSGPGGGGPRSQNPGGSAPRTARPREPQPADLIVPLATLLGLAERPGDIHGFGLLDPALARELAAAAAASPRSTVCVTVTSPEGYAIGHGCARADRVNRAAKAPEASLIGLPARLNLTIPATALPGLTGLADLGGQPGPWTFAPHGSSAPPGRAGPQGSTPPPDGYGTWTLVLPGGRRLTVRLDPVPTMECDHRYETHGYQPGDKLRHLVQVRDGTCTFPPCNRHARESDFEHCVPYDQGGKTCACNAGARSRACHQVKQSPGWKVTQPRPGWHQWQTPSGRIYIQEPKRYPT